MLTIPISPNSFCKLQYSLPEEENNLKVSSSSELSSLSNLLTNQPSGIVGSPYHSTFWPLPVKSLVSHLYPVFSIRKPWSSLEIFLRREKFTIKLLSYQLSCQTIPLVKWGHPPTRPHSLGTTGQIKPCSSGQLQQQTGRWHQVIWSGKTST